MLQGGGTNPPTTISLSEPSFPTSYTTVSAYCLSFGCDGPTFLTGGSWSLNALGGAGVGARRRGDRDHVHGPEQARRRALSDANATVRKWRAPAPELRSALFEA